MSELDLSKVTLAGGAKIAFHLQFPEDIKLFQEAYPSLEDLENDIRLSIGKEEKFADFGEGQTVHILVARSGVGRVLNDEEFAEWEKNPEWPEESDPLEDMIQNLASEMMHGSEPDLENNKIDTAAVTTSDGSEVVFDWEDPEMIHDFEKEMTQEDFQEGVRDLIENFKIGNSQLVTGPGKKVCIITDSNRDSTALSEVQYVEWNKTRDWQKPFNMVVDMEKVTMEDGRAITLRFEDKALSQAKINGRFDQVSFEKVTRNLVKDTAKDKGVDLDSMNSINVLINAEGNVIAIMSDEEYTKWAQNPVWKDPNEPVKPTKELVASYQDNELAKKLDYVARLTKHCAFCLSSECPGRHESFNQAEFDAALAKAEAELA